MPYMYIYGIQIMHSNSKLTLIYGCSPSLSLRGLQLWPGRGVLGRHVYASIYY